MFLAEVCGFGMKLTFEQAKKMDIKFTRQFGL
jgi:hypothetical protein